MLRGSFWPAASRNGWAVATRACCRLPAAAYQSPASIAVACSGGKRHPTFALWPTGCRDALRHFLVDEDIRRVSAFIDRHGFVEVEFPLLQSAGHPVDPFFNINQPDDL